MTYSPEDANPIYYSDLNSINDAGLEVMLALYKFWGLSGSLASGSVKFSTGPYDNRFQNPQVVVTSMGCDRTTPLCIGSTGSYYQDFEQLKIDIFVRTSTDSNTSIGSAKNNLRLMRQEVDRLLRSGSRFNNSTDERFIIIDEWKRLDLANAVPPIMRIQEKVLLIKTFKGVT